MLRRRRLMVAATILLLALLVWRTRIWDAGPLLAGADPWLLLAGLALAVPLIALWGLRSRLLLDAAGHRLRWLDLSLVTTFAGLANSVTPASTGEVLRALVLRDRYGVPLPTGVAVILIERFYALVVIVFAAGAATVVTLWKLTAVPAALVWLAAVALSALPAVAYRTPLRVGWLLRAMGLTHARRPAKIQSIASGLIEAEEAMAGLLRRPLVVGGFLAVTFPTLGVFTAQLWLILLALGVPVPLNAVWASIGAAMLAGILSALPFGLGATEVVGAGILIGLGVDATVAGTAYLLLRVISTLPIGLAGGVASMLLARQPRA